MPSTPEFVPSRIQKFRDACDAHDWEYAEDWFARDYRVKAWRGDSAEERICLIWRDGNFSGEGESWYELVDIRKKNLSNQAEGVRFVESEPDYTFAKDEEGKNLLIKNAYDWSGYEDAEVIKILDGRKIKWGNTLTLEYEEAIVPHKGKHTHITVTSGGRRIITFAEVGGGFRSVALEMIASMR